MPKALAEVDADDEFDVNVYVPEGDDDMDDAANVVEAMAQRLTNRTRHLRNRMGRLAGANTWTGTFNTFQTPVNINDQLTIVPEGVEIPAIHISRAAGAGDYQLVTTIMADAGSDRVRIYSGRNGDTQGALYIVYNAWFLSGSWRLVNTGKPASALIFRSGDVRFVGKPANVNPATWTHWDSAVGDLGSTVLGQILRGHRVTATANTYLDHTNGFRYTTPIERVSPIPIGLAWGNVYYNADGHLCRRATDPDEANAVWFPVPVPPFCSFSQVHVNFYQHQSSEPDRFQLYRKQQQGAWTPVGGYGSIPIFAPGVTLGVGDITPPGAPITVLDGDEYAYKWTLHSGDPAVWNNRIVGLSVTWSDVGPNNRVG